MGKDPNIAETPPTDYTSTSFTSNADVQPSRTTVTKAWSPICQIPHHLMHNALCQLYNWWLEERRFILKGLKGKLRRFPSFTKWMEARLDEFRQYRQQEINETQNDLNNAYAKE